MPQQNVKPARSEGGEADEVVMQDEEQVELVPHHERRPDFERQVLGRPQFEVAIPKPGDRYTSTAMTQGILQGILARKKPPILGIAKKGLINTRSVFRLRKTPNTYYI